MKSQLIAIVAAVLVVGCGPKVDIWTAAKKGNIEAVKQHLAAGVDVNAKTESEWTPLHRAAWGRHTEIVELLIAKGADVNAKDDGSWTSLHSAAMTGSNEIVGLLIAEGADVNAKANGGLTPLILTEEEKQTETADLLRKHGGKAGSENHHISTFHFPV